MLTVRELFLKALSMKLSGTAWPRIQDTLIILGRDIGIKKIGTDFVEFRSGQRIWFDGRCLPYNLVARLVLNEAIGTCGRGRQRIILQRLQRRGDHGGDQAVEDIKMFELVTEAPAELKTSGEYDRILA